ncbi:MAG: geranylgeranylglycerol-phosphate geranylgeranyltransferase [Candidatus Heimdallarchaeota archaeon]|nr:geranylgeranylglycerol-phosphate geranylgeranyltransferase [Candidatus Heimdallarchaeota archaeon]
MSIRGYFFLGRPLNSTLSGLSVAIGAIAALSAPLTETQVLYIILGCITAGFISAFGYAINDIFDVEIDKINMPHRPIPSGSVSLQGAKYFTLLTVIVGLFFAFLIDIVAILLTLFGLILLYLYASNLKRSGFPGNLVVASLASIPFLFGGFVTQSYNTLIYPASFAFLLNLGRELIKDIEDVKGDELENVQSIALRYGVKPARNLAFVILSCLILIIPVPIILGYYTSIPFLIAVLTIFGVILYSATLTFNKSEDEIISGTTPTKRILKTCMSIGVIGFLSEGILNLIKFTF